jgi:hypothetical protein
VRVVVWAPLCFVCLGKSLYHLHLWKAFLLSEEFMFNSCLFPAALWHPFSLPVREKSAGDLLYDLLGMRNYFFSFFFLFKLGSFLLLFLEINFLPLSLSLLHRIPKCTVFFSWGYAIRPVSFCCSFSFFSPLPVFDIDDLFFWSTAWSNQLLHLFIEFFSLVIVFFSSELVLDSFLHLLFVELWICSCVSFLISFSYLPVFSYNSTIL